VQDRPANVGNENKQVEQWLQRCARGDHAALEALLLHFHDELMGFIKALVRGDVAHWTTAEDLMQDTLMEAFRHAPALDVRGADAFGAWLKTIARTRLINQIEARKAAKRGGAARRVTTAGNPDDTAQTILHMIASNDPTPSLITRRKELQVVLAQAIRRLDPERAKVLQLRYQQGLGIADIAREVGKGESAVKMLISRTLQELRAMMMGCK